MLRALAAIAALIAVIVGFLLAPQGHVHLGRTTQGDDGHHGRLGAGFVKHAHLTAHARPGAAATRDTNLREEHSGDEQPVIRSTADEFVFQAVDGPCGLEAGDLVPTPAAVPPRSCVWAVLIEQPPAHGPPGGGSVDSRGPPSVPPAAA